MTINNQWSQRHTVVEVTGLDRPGLLYELTTTLSKLNLNIASAHVATFGERVVDVFYVTDLLGAKITTPTRQAAIKRPLLALFTTPSSEAKLPRTSRHAHFGESFANSITAASNCPLKRTVYGPRDAPGTRAGTGHGLAKRPQAHRRRRRLRFSHKPGRPRRRSAEKGARHKPPPAQRSVASAEKEKGPRRRPRQRPLRIGRLFYWGAVLALWGVICAIGIVIWVGAHLPPIQSLEIPKRPPSIQIVGINGATLATRGDMGGAAVPLRELPPTTCRRRSSPSRTAASIRIAASIRSGIARAVVANVLRRGVSQGGSTITQQLAKNLFLTQERTVTRKLQEVVLALWLEHKFSKDADPRTLSQPRLFRRRRLRRRGAAQRYFGKSARQVTLAEAAMLAGLVKSPSRLAPTRNPDGAERRARRSCSPRWRSEGFIAPRTLAKPRMAQPADARQAAEPTGSVNYVADWVMDALDDLIGQSR